MNNRIVVRGEIVSDFIYSHEMLNEKFYIFHVKTRRLGDSFDVLPVIASERIIANFANCNCPSVEIYGHIRSWNAKGKVLVFVFAKGISLKNVPVERDYDIAFLDGYICKAPIYRKTPLGREITDLLLAVNRPYGKTDYIPCICWGKGAKFAKKLSVGTQVSIMGRMQSREYTKKLDDGTEEIRTAYEVSVIRINELEGGV